MGSLGLSWGCLGLPLGRKTAQSRPRAGVPPKSLKSSPLPHRSSIFVPSWGSLGLFWGSLGVFWGSLGTLLGSLGAFLARLGFLVSSHLLSWGSLGLHLVLSGSLGLSWGSLGALLGSLGAPLGSLGHSWVCLGLSQGFQASSATLASRFPKLPGIQASPTCLRSSTCVFVSIVQPFYRFLPRFVSFVVGSCMVDGRQRYL